jgi:hypothetical protein
VDTLHARTLSETAALLQQAGITPRRLSIEAVANIEERALAKVRRGLMAEVGGLDRQILSAACSRETGATRAVAARMARAQTI